MSSWPISCRRMSRRHVAGGDRRRGHYNAGAPWKTLAIARMLGEIADLLEIKGDNPFKIRAYRNAAETVVAEPSRVADMDDAALRELPGIGKDLGAAHSRDRRDRRHAVSARNCCRLSRRRCSTCCGCRASARRRSSGSTTSWASLARRRSRPPAKDGRVRALKGMGDKKQALILKAIEERKRYAGRHLLGQATRRPRALVALAAGAAPDADFTPVGSLRRGVRDLRRPRHPRRRRARRRDGRASPRYPRSRGSSARGETKASVLLRGRPPGRPPPGGAQVRGAALQYFTGSKAHNIALRDRALSAGFS